MPDYLHALPAGYRLEEYELVRVLGSGGFGITYLGYDHHLDKAVAIKEYLPNDLAVRADNQSVLPKSTDDKADYEWGLERFLTEAQTLARFDHRHLIKVHRFFRAHGTGYIVMEYAEGETLSELLQREGTLTEAGLQAILFPILDGLAVVHEVGFLHRDIKPSNIVIRADGSAVLIDFGSARQAVAGKSRSVTAIVTPGYAPIEQYSAKGHQGAWTDIYALGAVCYRCLTGEVPEDATERLRDDPLVPAAQRCKGKASAALLNAIDRALRVEEGARPQSIAAWRAMLSNKTAALVYREEKETARPAVASSSSPSPSPGRKDSSLSKLVLAG
ncbi:MAG: serine/threonine-protein kinase, partial [Gammaproteobacteria bacterium]|nr:serine/threonine-protein kinase [Gammaproteobacteria bacterium]